jgi:hypothetical protein
MLQRVDKGYTAPIQKSYIAYGLEPGVPEPDISMATTAFAGPAWVEPQPGTPEVRQRAAQWLGRHRDAMSRLSEL